MIQSEFMDKLFGMVNESDNLPICDIDADAVKNVIKVYLTDGSVFKIQCGHSGYWWILA